LVFRFCENKQREGFIGMNVYPEWVVELIDKREECRMVALAFLNIERYNTKLAGSVNSNGREINRLVAQHIWNLRFLKEG
jgi:hypothetical protein